MYRGTIGKIADFWLESMQARKQEKKERNY